MSGRLIAYEVVAFVHLGIKVRSLSNEEQVTMTKTRPCGIHLVGSAPFATSGDLFRTVGRELGAHVERVPDGEPGERSGWTTWQLGFLARSPLVEVVPSDYSPDLREVRLKDGVDPADVQFDDLGYANEAIASYRTFVAAKQAGDVPAHVRFQVSLPTPLGVLAGAMASFGSRASLEPAYEAAMLREVDRICAAIPHDQLAIQWDLCLETLLWEDNVDDFIHLEWWRESRKYTYWDGHDGIVERTARLTNAVPRTVHMGLHFCYGSFQGRHDVEPKDLGNVAELATALLEAADRPVQFMHMPVPVERSDQAYFAPLAGLRLPEQTKLYLGLLHLSDGEAGAAKRIDAAQAVVASFGVATECGWGGRAPGDMPELLRLHATTSEPIT